MHLFSNGKDSKTQRKYFELTESHKISENKFEHKFIRIYEDDIPNLEQELGIVLTAYFGITNGMKKKMQNLKIYHLIFGIIYDIILINN